MEADAAGCGGDGPGLGDSPSGHGLGWFLPAMIVGGLFSGAWRDAWGRQQGMAAPAGRSGPQPAHLDPRWALQCLGCGSRVLPEFYACPRCGGRLAPAKCEYCGQIVLRGVERCAACGSLAR